MSNRPGRLSVFLGTALLALWHTTGAPAQVSSPAPDAPGTVAAAPVLFPAQGGQGTVFTLTLATGGFGQQRGAVLLGKKACAIVAWASDSIQARISWDVKPGLHDVTIIPWAGGPYLSEPIVLPRAFKVVLPAILSTGPVNVVAGDDFELATVNLPPRQGTASLSLVTGGPDVPVTVLSWSSASVNVLVPNVAPGTYDLVLSTDEGDVVARSLFTVQDRAPGIDWDYVWKGHFHTTAVGIFYGGKVCRFFSGYDDTDGIRYDISDHPADHGTRGQVVDANGTAPSTHGNVMPVVLGGRLYLFWTVREGGFFEYTSTDSVEYGEPRWAKLQKIAAPVAAGKRPNVVYHPATKAAYIYFQRNTRGQEVGILRLKDGATAWEDVGDVHPRGQDDHTLYSENDLSATVNAKNEVMLATTTRDRIFVFRSPDGLRTVDGNRVLTDDFKSPPYARGLGQGETAFFWQDRGDHVNLRVYGDDNGSWGERRRFGTETYRVPTCMPVPGRYTGDKERGQGMELRLWFFFFDHENVYGREESYLGELRVTEEKTTNWAKIASEMDLPPSEEDRTTLDVIMATPLVGVVDAPPPAALNGDQPKANRSHFTFVHIDQKTDSVKNSWKVGYFATTGPMSYAAVDLHIGYQRAWSESTTTTSKVSYSFPAYYEPGKVGALHAVPVTLARKLEVYRGGRKIEGLPPVIVLQVVDTSLLHIPVDPPADARMKRHRVGDLASYRPTAGGYDFSSKTTTWMGNAAATVELGIARTTSTSNGVYSSLRAGGNVPTLVAFGFEGEFNMSWTTDTTTSDNWALVMDNAPATETGHVKGFVGTLMLFNPTKEQYWVPDYVKNGRDSAWFVTYDVGSIQYR